MAAKIGSALDCPAGFAGTSLIAVSATEVMTAAAAGKLASRSLRVGFESSMMMHSFEPHLRVPAPWPDDAGWLTIVVVRVRRTVVQWPGRRPTFCRLRGCGRDIVAPGWNGGHNPRG